MTIEKGKISGLGLGILITCFMQGSLLLTAFTDKITMNGTWIVTLTGYIASLPFILAYIRLAKKFHGKNLVQINDIIYGRYLGKIISAAYIWLFIEICTLSLYGMGNFINAIMLNRTPILVLYTAFILVCAWAVRGGIEVIARCCFILLIITSLDIFTTFVFLLKDMHFSNFLPLFDVPVQNYIQGTQIMFSIPFAELIVFMMIFAYINNASKLKRSVMLGFTGGTISIFIIVIRNTATLGPLVSIISFPSFHAASLINIGEVFTRLEILVASAFMITIFIKICVFYMQQYWESHRYLN
jgi:spore germination protein KB